MHKTKHKSPLIQHHLKIIPFQYPQFQITHLNYKTSITHKQKETGSSQQNSKRTITKKKKKTQNKLEKNEEQTSSVILGSSKRSRSTTSKRRIGERLRLKRRLGVGIEGLIELKRVSGIGTISKTSSPRSSHCKEGKKIWGNGFSRALIEEWGNYGLREENGGERKREKKRRDPREDPKMVKTKRGAAVRSGYE